MRRYVLTGAPGAGKTSIARALGQRGYPVVDEAATDVIAAEQARGVAQPWAEPGFVAAVVRLQRRRRNAETRGPVQVHDRSPLCTLALAEHLGHPVGPELTAELERVDRERIYQRTVFLVGSLGFVIRTAARRISLADALAFGRLHARVYAEYGYELVEVPPGPVAQRAAFVAARLDPC
ncbi:ATPase [Micromonospora sp. 15K316]|uniref:AAA family ATPase n=1 Tax=Micromonospora sp. 15K316 TaxID=2530376 RepID=UPI0010526F87|nr:AAA family ATPase [Micromonospora sp. 15K316]TDC30145.1 ATPase [Micromonospora sp. 15K316]